ncbi:outer membrane protein B [Rhodobiaceae bacterium]|nr:outer membrane protein B [Rhodobiaceae bacterium]
MVSSFQHLQSVLLRGGRMTKVAGRAASYAPQLGLAQLGAALFASVPLLMTGPTTANAACVDMGGGTIECSGTITTPQSLGPPPAGTALTVSTTAGTSINAAGTALNLTNAGGDLGITFTDTHMSSITGSAYGVYALNNGSGAISITTSGTVTGTTQIGVYAFNKSTGTNVTIETAAVTGGDDGIQANNRGSGALSVTATGQVIGGSHGISAYNGPTTSGGLTIQAAAVTGAANGISATNAGSGALSITATGDVVGTGSRGILVTNSGTDLTIRAAAVTGSTRGILATNRGSGALSITTTGDVSGQNDEGINASNTAAGTALTIAAAAVTGAQDGIRARNSGSGALSVTATGTVTGGPSFMGGPGYDGIYASNSNAGTALTVETAMVTGGKRGIYAINAGTGALLITSTGTATGTSDDGISANNSSNAGTDVTIQTAAVAGGRRGIFAVNQGSGAMSITATGSVTGATDDGISARNNGNGALTIEAAAVTGSVNGIFADNGVTGAVSITVSGAVTGGTGVGISTYADRNKAVTITLNAGSTVSATSGNAILDRNGMGGGADATVTVNAGSAIVGSIDLGDGSDTIVLAGGDVTGVTSFDGGDDSSAGDSFIDTVRVTGTTSLAGANVTNFEKLEVASGGSLSLTDNMLAVGDGTAGTGVFIQSGGTLLGRMGTTTLSAPVTIGGTLSVPAGSTVSISGDTTFEASSRFQVGIASDVSAGLLKGDGSAIVFNAGSEVFADVTQGAELGEGGTRVATATNGITDNGLTVDDNSVIYEFTHEVRNAGADLFLIAKRALTAFDATTNGSGGTNAESIASAIDLFLDTAPTDNVIATYLAQFPVGEQEAQLLQLVKDSLPSESSGDGSATIASADLVLDLITDRLSGGGSGVAEGGARQMGVAAGEKFLGGPGNWTIWGRAGASFAEFEPSGVNGFEADTYGVSLGMDGDIAQDLRMGVAVFYSDTEVDEIGVAANSNQDIEGYGVLFYGGFHPDDFYVNATAGIGLNEYDSQRRAAGGVNTANYDGTQFMGRVELGKVFSFGDLDLTPHVGLRYNKISIDGYTETGPLPTTIGSQSITSLRGVFGVGWQYTHELNDGSKLIPEGYVRGLQELADPNEAITGNIVGGGTFVSQTTERDKFSYAAGAGLSYDMDDQVSLSFMYDGEFQSDYQEHSLTAAIRYQF